MIEPIDFYCSLYERLQYKNRLTSLLQTPFRKGIRYIATSHISHYYATHKACFDRDKTNVIVSLTSFPGRINIVHLVVNSMLRQTCLPKKIILWLSKKQFSDTLIPSSLALLENDIFEIRMVDEDIRSYKKSYYVLKEFPDNPVFLIDDDLFYPTNTIETVLKAANQYPGYVICRFGSIMKYKDGNPKSYNSWWDEIVNPTTDPNLFLGTGGGTLLRREYLFDEVDNIELALSLAPLADDVWMNAMINLKKTPKHKVKYGLILPIYQKKGKTLTSVNVGENLNDKQISSVREYFINHYGLDPFEKRVD